MSSDADKFAELEEHLTRSRRQLEQELAPLLEERGRLVQCALAQKEELSHLQRLRALLSGMLDRPFRYTLVPIAATAAVALLALGTYERAEEMQHGLDERQASVRDREMSTMRVAEEAQEIPEVEDAAEIKEVEGSELAMNREEVFSSEAFFDETVAVPLILIDERYETEDSELAWTAEDMTIDLGEIQESMLSGEG